jgi:small-conductance mechanosensitive channel
MEVLNVDLMDMLIPLAFITAGIILGLIIEIVVMKVALKYAKTTAWEVDEIIVLSFKGIILLYTYLLGIYLATLFMSELSDSVRGLINNILLSIVVLVTAHVFSKIIVGFTRRETSRIRGVPASTTIISLLPRLLLYLAAAMIVLNVFGITILPFIAAFGIIGLALALAVQETLANLFAGFQIIASKKIKPGQYIKLDSGEQGIIKDISWRNTSIHHSSNYMIIVPNSKLAGSVVENYDVPVQEIGFVVYLEVSYYTDLDRLEKVLLEEATKIQKTVEGGLRTYEPIVRYYEFGDASVKVKVIMRGVEYSSKNLMTHEFIKNIHKRFEKEGFEMNTPEQLINLKKVGGQQKAEA